MLWFWANGSVPFLGFSLPVNIGQARITMNNILEGVNVVHFYIYVILSIFRYTLSAAVDKWFILYGRVFFLGFVIISTCYYSAEPCDFIGVIPGFMYGYFRGVRFSRKTTGYWWGQWRWKRCLSAYRTTLFKKNKSKPDCSWFRRTEQ